MKTREAINAVLSGEHAKNAGVRIRRTKRTKEVKREKITAPQAAGRAPSDLTVHLRFIHSPPFR